MINFDEYTNENKMEHNSKWSYIPDHPYRILLIGGSGSGKTNALLNLINNQPDIDKKYLYAKDPYETKYQYLINKHEKVGLDHFDDPKAFMEYSNDMQDVYRFDASNYSVDRPLPKGKNELGGGIITEFVALRPKTYSYMTDEFIEMKKAKVTKKCVIKKMLKCED